LEGNPANLWFYDASTAGNASITNNGQLFFSNASTAGRAGDHKLSAGRSRVGAAIFSTGAW
jgi:hypothetical protein